LLFLLHHVKDRWPVNSHQLTVSTADSVCYDPVENNGFEPSRKHRVINTLAITPESWQQIESISKLPVFLPLFPDRFPNADAKVILLRLHPNFSEIYFPLF
jgi:hypothetical protein